jgi:CDP-diacylglycerol--serine O-phosphatidyltransferase
MIAAMQEQAPRPLVIVKVGSTFEALRAQRGDFEHWIADGLATQVLPVLVVDPRRGDTLPALDAVAGVVVTGSHAMVSHREPWSETTAAWLAQLVARDTPVLGICYGHQLLAHALGGEAGDHPRGAEVGTVTVTLAEAAATDALLGGLPAQFPANVVHWQSALRLPDGAVRLAGNATSRCRPFAWAAAWGVQFHPEFDADDARLHRHAGRRPAQGRRRPGRAARARGRDGHGGRVARALRAHRGSARRRLKPAGAPGPGPQGGAHRLARSSDRDYKKRPALGLRCGPFAAFEASRSPLFMNTPPPTRKHFSMIREFHLADVFTLGNAACGVGGVFLAMAFMASQSLTQFLWAAALAPAAFIFDVFDGRIARWRQTQSALGRELDSLADIISFGVAPAALGFAAGLDGGWDCAILIYFVCCGVSRLARYNVTAESLSEGANKVKYFEGTPIPTSVVLVGVLAYAAWQGHIGSALWGGAWVVGPWQLHPLSLMFALSGTLMISKTLRIPKF